MSLKIIAGSLRGRPLQSVKGMGTRPLLGQVREALFNILQDRVEDAVVWDLFAGTGANGLEALSRGARQVVFVEKAAKPYRILEENLEALGGDVDGDFQALRGDAWQPPHLVAGGDDGSGEGGEGDGDPGEPPPSGARPDIVFFDPPYPAVGEDPAKAVHRATRIAHAMADDGVLLFHFRDGVLHDDDFDSGLATEIRVWGRSAIAFLTKA